MICPFSAGQSSSGTYLCHTLPPRAGVPEAQPQRGSSESTETSSKPLKEGPILSSRVSVQETGTRAEPTEGGRGVENIAVNQHLPVAHFEWSQKGLEETGCPPVVESGPESGASNLLPLPTAEPSVPPQYEYAEGGLWLSESPPVAERGEAAVDPNVNAVVDLSGDVDLGTGKVTFFLHNTSEYWAFFV